MPVATPQRIDVETNAPHDSLERERLDSVHPPGWRNPRPANRYSLVVIGGGTAGLVAAHAAASLGARVALVERALLGGDCLSVGCVPSKAIIRTSRLYSEMRDAQRYGAQIPADIRVDFAAVMARMRGIRARIGRADSVQRLVAAGVDVFFGKARFAAPDALTVDGVKLRFKKAMIATGSRPDTPAIPGLVEAGFLTNEIVFDLTELPRRLLAIGGGPLARVIHSYPTQAEAIQKSADVDNRTRLTPTVQVAAAVLAAVVAPSCQAEVTL